MKYRRVLSLALASTMLLCPTLTSLAGSATQVSTKVERVSRDKVVDASESKLTEAEVLEKANAFLKTIEVEMVSEVYDVRLDRNGFYYGENKKLQWELQWEVDVEGGSDFYTINIDADNGDILNYRGTGYSRNGDYDDTVQRIKAPQYTGEQCLEIAKIYKKLLGSDQTKDLEYNEDEYSSNEYTFSFNKRINGIYSPYEGMVIGIDAATGKLCSYRATMMENLVYESPDNIKTVEEAKKVYSGMLDLEYGYSVIRDRHSNPKKVIGIYQPEDRIYQLDATDLREAKYIYSDQEEEESKLIKGSYKINPEQLKKYDITDKELPEKSDTVCTREDIKDATKEFMNIFDSKLEYTMDWIDKRFDYDGIEKWSVRVKNADSNESLGRIEFDEYGKFIEFYRYSNGEVEDDLATKEDSQPLDLEVLKNKATELFATMYPEQFKKADYTVEYRGVNYHLGDEPYPNLYYYFSIAPEEFSDEYNMGIDLRIGAFSGTINRLNNRWVDLEIPKTDGIIGADVAKDNYFKHLSFELKYAKLNDASNKVSLVYAVEHKINDQRYFAIDAMTGSLLGNGDLPIKLSDNTSHTTHEADQAYSLLCSEYIIKDEMKKALTDKATQKDALLIVLSAMDVGYWDLESFDEKIKYANVAKGDEYYNDLRLAIKKGLLSNEEVEWDWDAPVLRKDMARYLAIALGYEDLGAISKLYTLKCKDSQLISEEYKGYIAIVEGLGYMFIDEDGNFNPDQEMSYGDVVMAIYNVVTR